MAKSKNHRPFFVILAVVFLLVIFVGAADFWSNRLTKAREVLAEDRAAGPEFAPDEVLIKLKPLPVGGGEGEMAPNMAASVRGIVESSLPKGVRVAEARQILSPIPARAPKAPKEVCVEVSAESEPEPVYDECEEAPELCNDGVKGEQEPTFSSEEMPEPEPIAPSEPTDLTSPGGVLESEPTAPSAPEELMPPEPTMEAAPEELLPEEPVSRIGKFAKYLANLFSSSVIASPDEVVDEAISSTRCFSVDEALTGKLGSEVKNKVSKKVQQYQEKQQRREKGRRLSKELGLDRWYSVKLSLSGRESELVNALLRGKSSAELTRFKKDYFLNLIAKISENPNVEDAQPNYIYHATAWAPNDPFFSSSGSWGQSYDDLWGIKRIKADQVWGSSDPKTQGEGVVVAVIDTGIDYNHPDLADNIWTNPGEIANNGIDDDGNGYIDDVRGWNFAGGWDKPNDPMDEFGHGTHVAGTIGAVANNGIGVVGVAPKVKLMAVKGLGDSGGGSSINLKRAIEYAADNGAQITNSSWGGATIDKDGLLEDAFDYAYGLDVLNVAAAGNDARDNARAYYMPANFDTTMTVSATTEEDFRALFSNYGTNVDIAAPGGGSQRDCNDRNGCNILSTMPDSSYLSLILGRVKIAPGYYRLWGTSMATPHIAGAAALVLAQQPDLTVDELRGVLEISADPTGTVNGYLGRGRVNVKGAVSLAKDTNFSYGWLKLPKSPMNGTIAIEGFVKGAGLKNYRLSYVPTDYKYLVDNDDYFLNLNPPGKWIQLASSASSVDGNYADPGILGYFDAKNLDNGSYLISLTAQNSNGQRTNYYAPVLVENSKITFPANHDIFRLGSEISISGEINAPYQNYWLEYGEGFQPETWSAVGISKTGSANGARFKGGLAVWDTSSLVSKGSGFYTLKLTVTLKPSGKRITAFSYMIYLDDKIKDGWPQRLSFPLNPQIVDLDGDGKKEIVVLKNNWDKGSEFFSVVAFNSNGTIKWERPLNKTTSGFFGFNWWRVLAPVIVDFNGDGLMELIVVSPGGFLGDSFVYLLNYDGSVVDSPLWPIKADVIGSITVADLDNDGRSEIIFPFVGIGINNGSDSGLAIYNSDGRMLRQIPLVDKFEDARSFVFVSNVAVGNFDSDEELELAFTAVPDGAMPYQIMIMNRDGSPLPSWPKELEGLTSSPLSVGDVNNDGFDEVIATSMTPFLHGEEIGGRVYVFDRNGNDLTVAQPIRGDFTGAAALADFNGDGELEIAVPRGNEMILTDYQGNNLWEGASDDYDRGLIWSSAYVADVNSDGVPDVIGSTGGVEPELVEYGDTSTSGGVYVWDGESGSVMFNLFRDSSAADETDKTIHDPNGGGGMVAIGDIDSDGVLEIVSSNSLPRRWYAREEKRKGYYGESTDKKDGAILVWELENSSNILPSAAWPMYTHDTQHTSRYVEPPELPQTWQNPVNRFDIDGNGNVAPLDVLTLVHAFNNPPEGIEPNRLLPTPTPELSPPPYYDVNGDGVLSPLDVLELIREINNSLEVGSMSAPSSAAEGESMSFSAAAAGNLVDERELEYSWNFGDGSTAFGKSVSHTFRSSGTYPVEITITENVLPGFTRRAKKSKNVKVTAPVSNLPNYIVENPTAVKSGWLVNLRAVVKNIGGKKANRASYTAFKVNGRIRGYGFTPAIAPGASKEVATRVWLRRGNYTLEVCADQFKFLKESDESDNCSSRSINIR